MIWDRVCQNLNPSSWAFFRKSNIIFHLVLYCTFRCFEKSSYSPTTSMASRSVKNTVCPSFLHFPPAISLFAGQKAYTWNNRRGGGTRPIRMEFPHSSSSRWRTWSRNFFVMIFETLQDKDPFLTSLTTRISLHFRWSVGTNLETKYDCGLDCPFGFVATSASVLEPVGPSFFMDFTWFSILCCSESYVTLTWRTRPIFVSTEPHRQNRIIVVSGLCFLFACANTSAKSRGSVQEKLFS